MSKNTFSTVLVCLALASVPFVAAPAGAALFGKPQQVKTDVYPIHDDATFAEKTKTFDVPLFDKPELEYVITLPKDWQMENVADFLPQADNLNTQKILEDVTRFKSPFIGTSQLTTTIQIMQLDHEISARDWLKNHIIVSGYAPDGEMTHNGTSRASAAFFYTLNGVSFYSYATAQITGNHILVARFDIPANMKEPLNFFQKKAIDSFKILYPKDDPIEPQLTFTMADAIKFNYPGSWDTTGTNLKDLNRLTVRLNNRDVSGTLQGLIQTVAVRRTRSTQILDEVENIKKYFTGLGFNIVEMTESKTAPVSKRFIFNRYEIYKIQKEGQNVQELHLVTLGDASWYVLSYMVTPQEHDNLYTWGRNTRTFELMMKSFK